MRRYPRRRALRFIVTGAFLVCAGAGAVDAGPAGAQAFTQCPAVGADTGCQFLIVVTDAGATVQQDSSQGPYEASDDSLIGVQNNSSRALAALPLSAAGLFGFEQDGICNPNLAGVAGPVAPGCRPAPGAPPGTICGPQNGSCSFPPPAGQPPGYTEPGAPSGTTQNGYEGPTTWFSNVAVDGSSGQVNFSPALAPGASTYFSLEAPPSAQGLMVGAPVSSGPPATLPPAFGPGGVIGIPSARKCLSRRHFTIRVRKRGGLRYQEAIVFVNHKRVGVLKGRRLAAPVDLRGLPVGVFRVQITVITTDGRIITGTRRYHTCTRKLPGHGPPRL
ncbi:MAG: hypothetical protein M3P44_00250 [Actinomycetota bacterium]|nr:hypothetical protein [Actinomycetota bacterium]